MTDTDYAIKALIADPALQKRLAKYIVMKCFRNSVLEDFHAGKVPDSKSGDYADVVVRTTFGEMPWNELSRWWQLNYWPLDEASIPL